MLRQLAERLGLLQAFAQGLLGDQLAVVVAQVALFAQGIEHAHGGGADAQGVHQAADGGLVVAGLAGGGAPTLGVQSGISHGVYAVLLGNATAAEAIVHSKAGAYDVLPANRALAGAEVELVQELAREMRLKNALAEVADEYDYILIDCPPTLTLLTINGLVAAQKIMVPMVCE